MDKKELKEREVKVTELAGHLQKRVDSIAQ